MAPSMTELPLEYPGNLGRKVVPTSNFPFATSSMEPTEDVDWINMAICWAKKALSAEYSLPP